MTRFALSCLAVLLSGAVVSTPARAQSRDGSSSLTHVVSVTLASRVKVKVSALSLTTPRSAGLALTVRANRPWVITTQDSLLASGTASSAVDTTVVFSSGKDPVVVTISAP